MTQIFLGNFTVTALAFSIHNFFIGQTCFAGGAPVDGHFLFICKPCFKHFYKNPLRPFIEIRICGIDFPVPIIDGCNFIDLFFDIGNIFCCGNTRMNAMFDRIILCRKTKGIPSHGMDEIISLHHFITAPDIRNNITSPVSHMKSVA